MNPKIHDPVIYILDRDSADEKILRQFLKILLPRAHVSAFEDADVLARAIRRAPPMLVIMAVMGAPEAKLLQVFSPAHRRFQILALVRATSAAMQSAVSLFRDLGADEVLSKPFDDLLLKGAIETALSGVYASSYSFFGSSRGQNLSAVQIKFKTELHRVNETEVFLSSPVHIQGGSEIEVLLGGKPFKAVVKECFPGDGNVGFMLQAALKDMETEAARVAVRRALLALQTKAVA